MYYINFFEGKLAGAEYYLAKAEEQGNVSQIADMSRKVEAYKAAIRALKKVQEMEA